MQSNPSDNCIHRYNVEILNIFDPELQLINTKGMIENKLKELISGLKKFKVQTIVVLDSKKRRLVIQTLTTHLNQNIMIKIKIYACKDWIALDVIIKHSFKISEC